MRVLNIPMVRCKGEQKWKLGHSNQLLLVIGSCSMEEHSFLCLSSSVRWKESELAVLRRRASDGRIIGFTNKFPFRENEAIGLAINRLPGTRLGNAQVCRPERQDEYLVYKILDPKKELLPF